MRHPKCRGLPAAVFLYLSTGLLLGQNSQITWKLQLNPQKDIYRPGDTLTLICQAQIPPPFHLYSARKPQVEANLPTQLEYDKIQGLQKIGNLKEKGNLISSYDSIFGTTIYYYEREAVFLQQYVVTKLPAELIGYIRYQYCDEERCFTQVHNFSYKLKGNHLQVLPPQPPADSEADTPATPSSSELPTFSTSATTAKFSSQTPKGEIFIMSFLFGLLALLTPCTFPMIPLTISYFTKSSTERKKSLRLAITYALSIVVIFLFLGVLFSLVVGASGAYHLSTNPVLNLIFFVLLVLFGLSFLGLFDITLPSSWVNRAGRRASLEGIGIFFMALTLVLAAFSCIGPLLGTLLIQAAGGGSVWTPLIGMLGFSLAFALPFGLLAYSPTLLHMLPKAGDWMEAFKVTLGFLELALSLKFLSNADLVWHLGILDREVYIAAEMVIFTFLGLYLLGKIPLHGHQPASIGVGRLVGSMLSFLFVVYMLPGLWGAPLKLLSGFLPPVHSEIGVRIIGGELVQSSGCNLPPTRKYASTLQKYTPAGFCVFYDLEEAQRYAASVDKPLFIDFTGHTCVNCRQVESSVWSDPTIRSLLGEYVMVSLFVDDSTPLEDKEVTSEGTILRTLGDKWLYIQKKQLGAQAQPYYVLADPTLKVLVEPLGFTLDKGVYQEFLKKGLELYRRTYAKNR